MNLNLYLAFVVSTAVLVAIPGPTVMLVTSIGMQRGVRAGFTAVLGSSTAAALYAAIIVVGLASIVSTIGEWFFWIRLVGAAYLIYLGVGMWRSRLDVSRRTKSSIPTARDFNKGFFTTATNPKMLFFLSAFFPQFVDPALPSFQQLAILSVSFLVLLTVLDGCWVVLAVGVGLRLRSERFQALGNKIAGTLLIGAGASLALAKRS